MKIDEKVWKLKKLILNSNLSLSLKNKFYNFLMKRWKMNQIELMLWY